MESKILRCAPFLALVALAGCGGGGGGSSSPIETSLGFSTSGGYNGTSTDLTGTPTATSGSGETVVTLASGGRTLAVNLPTTSFSVGDEFTFGGSSASAAGYSETLPGGSALWRATGGSVQVLRVRNGKAAFAFDVAFGPSSVSGNAAVGTFTLNGTVADVPVGG